MPTLLRKILPRQLSAEFMRDLQHGFLRPVLTRVQNDDSLALFIGVDAITVSYRGKSLFVMTRTGSDYGVDIVRTGLPGESESFGEVPKSLARSKPEEVHLLVDALAQLKQAADLACTAHPDMEKEFAQVVCRVNNRSSLSNSTDYFITDINVDFEGIGHFDLIGCRWAAGEERRQDTVQLVLVEMKYGNGIYNTNGEILRHVRDIEALLFDADRTEIVRKSVEMQMRQLSELGLLRHTRRTAPRFSVSRTVRPELILLVANHNPRAESLTDIINAEELRNNSRVDLRFFTCCAAGYAMYREYVCTPDAFRRQYLELNG